MVKEVELKKLNGITQYVDWETNEELFKSSDCITLDKLKELKKETEKKLEKEEMFSNEATTLIYELDFYNKLIGGEYD